MTGVPYRALVRVDDTNVIAETNENNNVTDTRQWYQRN
jgi:subtilase family serine protease